MSPTSTPPELASSGPSTGIAPANIPAASTPASAEQLKTADEQKKREMAAKMLMSAFQQNRGPTAPLSSGQFANQSQTSTPQGGVMVNQMGGR